MDSPRIVPRSSYFDLYPERKPPPSRPAPVTESIQPRRRSYSSNAVVDVVDSNPPRASSNPLANHGLPNLSLLQRARRGSAASIAALAHGLTNSGPSTSRPAPTTNFSNGEGFKTSPAATRRPSTSSLLLAKALGSSRSSPSLSDKAGSPSRSAPIDLPQARRESYVSITSSNTSGKSGHSGYATPKERRASASSVSSPSQARRPSAIALPPGLSESPEIRQSEIEVSSANAARRPSRPAQLVVSPPRSPVEVTAPPSNLQPPPDFLIHPDRRKEASSARKIRTESRNANGPPLIPLRSPSASSIFPSRSYPSRSPAHSPAFRGEGGKLVFPLLTTPRSDHSPSSFTRDLEAAFAATTGEGSTPPSPASTHSRFSIHTRKPIANIFPPRSNSSQASIIRHVESNPSLSDADAAVRRSPFRSRTSSVSSHTSSRGIGMTGSHSGAPSPTLDLFAGPGEYDPTTGAYRSTGLSRSGTTTSVASPADLDDLVASLNGRTIGGSRGGVWSSSKKVMKSTSSLIEAVPSFGRSNGVNSDGPERNSRSREWSADSDASFASMNARPSASQLSSFGAAPEMDRDRTLKAEEREELFGGVMRPPPLMYAPPALSYESSSSRPPKSSIQRGSFNADTDGRVDEDVLLVKKEGSSKGLGSSHAPLEASPSVVITEEVELPEPTLAPPPPPMRIRSIDEIVRQHADAAYLAKHIKPGTPAQKINTDMKKGSDDEALRITSDAIRSSIDSETVNGMYASVSLQDKLENGPFASPTSTTSAASATKDMSDNRSLSSQRASLSLAGTFSRQASSSPGATGFEALAVERELAKLLRSPKLTRIVTLRRHPNLGLSVSLADVGASNGHPVIVFLGLGCVRYLVALYDEMAQAFGLRLICLDRWGLGRTSEVPDERRGFSEWALIVDEVAEHLNLSSYSILAHSAGGPYALAAALRTPRRVHGSVHLLAPWISTSADSLAGGYKLLKYVPTGVIKTAQAADWKLTARRLGKPPTIQHAAVGYDHRDGKLQWTGGDEAGSPNGRAEEAQPIEEDGYDTVSLSSAKSQGAIKPKSSSSKTLLGAFFGGSPSSTLSTKSSTGEVDVRSLTTPTRGTSSTGGRRESVGSLYSPTSPSTTPTPTLTGSDLANGILRASHAESVRGATSDLMVILERTSRSSTVAKYTDLDAPVKVWHGDRDERISFASVKALEAQMKHCQVNIVEYADHNLMTNGKVMIEVLESIADEWR